MGLPMTRTVRPQKDEKPAGEAGHTNVTFMPGAVPPAHRKRRSRAWIWLPVIAVLAGAGYYGWHAYAPAETTTAVITQAVVRGDIENAVTAVGTLEAVKSVDAGAQVSGQLKTLHVAIGDAVKKDQLLAEMDQATIENRIEINRAELANLQAQLESKKAQLALKQANIARQRNLVAGNAAAKQALDQAVADAKGAYNGTDTVVGLITSGGKIAFAAPGEGRGVGAVFPTLGLVPGIDRGAENASHGDDISVEAIAAANPEWLIVLDRDAMFGEDGYVAAKELVEGSEALKNVPAVQKGQVVYLDPSFYLDEGIQAYTQLYSDIATAFAAAE